MIDVLFSLWRNWKMKRAMGEASTGDRCTACESPDVVFIAAVAYRCTTCGFEGGDGWAAYREQQRHARFAAMTPEARRASARDDLLEARCLLTSGIGDVERARSLSGLDMLGMTAMAHGAGGEGTEKHDALTAGVGLVLEARGRARDAQAKLGVSLGVAATAEGGGVGDTAATLDLFADNIFTDLLAHRDIGKTLDQARAMQRVVDRVLAEQFSA